MIHNPRHDEERGCPWRGPGHWRFVPATQAKAARKVRYLHGPHCNRLAALAIGNHDAHALFDRERGKRRWGRGVGKKNRDIA
jgi:hypothetical protein